MAPTGLGIKALAFFAVLIVCFYAAPYMNLFFLLLCFLGTVAGLAPVWTRRNLAGVTGNLTAIEPAPIGATARIEFALRAPDARRRFVLSCGVTIEGRRLTCARVDDLTERAVVRGEVPASARGVYRIEGAWVASTYPLGVLRARRPLASDAELVVHPAPAPLGNARTRADLIAEVCGNDLATDGDLGPAGVRDYRAGDELRHVHWRATARRGSLVVREWEASALRGLEVSLDLRATAAELEEALSLIAALALWAREHKEILALGSQDHRGTYGEGHESWDRLLRYLAVATVLPADAAPPPATSPNVLRLPRRAMGVAP